MPLAPAIPWVLGGLSAAATVVSANESRKAANKAADQSAAAANSAAAETQAVANYNASVDRAEASQVALDSAENVRAMRKDASVYLSRQRAAYAGAGVRVDTGSPLKVQIATAGALALREQQAHYEANARIARLDSAAGAGILEGSRRAEAIRTEGRAREDMYHREGTAAVLNGASRLIGVGFNQYLAAAPGPRLSGPITDSGPID